MSRSYPRSACTGSWTVVLQPADRLRLVQDVVLAIRGRDPMATEAAMAHHSDNARRRMFEG